MLDRIQRIKDFPPVIANSQHISLIIAMALMVSNITDNRNFKKLSLSSRVVGSGQNILLKMVPD